MTAPLCPDGRGNDEVKVYSEVIFHLNLLYSSFLTSCRPFRFKKDRQPSSVKMDIDKMFKLPALPSGGNKRKMGDLPNPGTCHCFSLFTLPLHHISCPNSMGFIFMELNK